MAAVVVINLAAAGVWLLLGRALQYWAPEAAATPWPWFLVALAALATALWVCKTLIEWPWRGRGRARE